MLNKITFEMLGKLNSEDWMVIIGLFAFLMWGLAIFLFGRISVKYIEREMAKEGIESPVWDKGIGGRIIMYAMVVVAKKTAKVSPVDDEAILRHTRPKDYFLAVFLIASSVFIFTVVGIVYFLYGPEN